MPAAGLAWCALLTLTSGLDAPTRSGLCACAPLRGGRLFCFLRWVLVSFLPSSYQCRPSSPPPRMWAITNTTPRSNSESRAMPKPGSMLSSYEP